MQKIIQNRGIKHVFHFTQLSNLDSILANGILTRDYAGARQLVCSINDHERWDGHTNASCCSIGFPNYKMFYRLQLADDNIEWVVLALFPSVLVEKDCAFYPTNAASNAVRHFPPTQYKGAQALQNLFSENPQKPTRAEMKLPDDCTTDPQAEVMVFDQIEPKYILGVATRTKALQEALSARELGVQIVHIRALFSGRIDAEHWKA